MTLTNSTMLTLGTKCPGFNLTDVVNGDKVLDTNFRGHPLLAMFICAHCPYVQHVQEELAQIGQDYADSELAIVAISSNDIESHPDDAPEYLKEQAEDLEFIFPYLFDETQEVAKNFTAACTPDLFLFDKDHKLVYRGQLDNSRPGNDIPVSGQDLREAIDTVLAGGKVGSEQKPSAGCNIKWKPGNAPHY